MAGPAGLEHVDGGYRRRRLRLPGGGGGRGRRRPAGALVAVTVGRPPRAAPPPPPPPPECVFAAAPAHGTCWGRRGRDRRGDLGAGLRLDGGERVGVLTLTGGFRPGRDGEYAVAAKPGGPRTGSGGGRAARDGTRPSPAAFIGPPAGARGLTPLRRSIPGVRARIDARRAGVAAAFDCRTRRGARRHRGPVVHLTDSGGARRGLRGAGGTPPAWTDRRGEARWAVHLTELRARSRTGARRRPLSGRAAGITGSSGMALRPSDRVFAWRRRPCRGPGWIDYCRFGRR